MSAADSKLPLMGDLVLTPREGDVLRCIVEGMTNAEIAVELGLTLNTVKSHLRCLLETMQADNRAHAVTIAFRRGLAK